MAATGEPYLMKTEDQASTVTSRIAFRGFDKPVTVDAPAADQVVDSRAFQKQVGEA